MTEPFHPHIANVIGIITLAIWLHLFFGRGWFWRVRKLDADRPEAEKLSVWPTVVAIVPARNEAETIGVVVTGLVQQDYPGTFSIVVVDDHSEDATRCGRLPAGCSRERRARTSAGSSSVSELPLGWTGKLWALNEGLSHGGVTQAGVSKGWRS